MAHLVEVSFNGNRKEFFLWDYPDPPPLNAAVIVDVERGEDLGHIHAVGEMAAKRSGGCAHGCGSEMPDRKALRLATSKDRTQFDELKRLNEEARRKAMEKVRSNGLGMKLSDAEWQWDRKKLTLYFTAEKRVDFRNLVRDLASLFRTRIELKQIGVRDEAKRLDGIGRCGRQYCSASWLPELRPVNLGVAKEQRLSLNPSQISGACGRLMCCLRYEHEFYAQSRRRFPKEGRVVTTAKGEEKVVSIDIFSERVTLRLEEGEMRTISLAEFNQEIGTGGAVAAIPADDEDAIGDAVPDEISPELLYTAEHEVPQARAQVVADPQTVTDREAAGAVAAATEPRPIQRAAASRLGKYYLTCAIDYANGDPHLGHAFEKIGADAIARYRRLRGDDVHFLIGMDEHGQKVAQAATARGMSPQQLVDEIASRFESVWRKLGISHDTFMRTTGAHHQAGVVTFIKTIAGRNPDDFYEKEYEGWYCVGCELFKRDNEIADGKCILHPSLQLQWTKERNWFFRLSRYADFLSGHIDQNKDFIQPPSRRNEIKALIAGGLDDISITRSRLSWAVPFPIPTADGETQGTWVWFDALPNYLTATGYPAPGYEKLWPADLHIIGKDITRLHCVIWPAMLKSAGLALPLRVWAHGFVLLDGNRFSKSAGVTLDLDEAIERYGPDAFRYFLLREVPFDRDGTFSWERFDERYNAELANSIGNLASRVIAMVDRYNGGVVPSAPRNEVDATDEADLEKYHAAMGGSRGFLLHEGIQAVLRTVARANEYVDQKAPWKLAKDPALKAELDAVLASLVRQLARQAVYLFPFMPEKMTSLWAALGAPGDPGDQRFASLGALSTAGWRVTKTNPLFPKRES